MSRAVYKAKVLQNVQILLPAMVRFFLPSRACLLEVGSKQSSVISRTNSFDLILKEGFLPAVFWFFKHS